MKTQVLWNREARTGGVLTIDINWLDEMTRVLYGFWAGEVEEVEDLEDEEFHVEEGYDAINFCNSQFILHPENIPK